MVRSARIPRKCVTAVLAVVALLTGLTPVRAGCWGRTLGLPCCCVETSNVIGSANTSSAERRGCCCCDATDPDPADLPTDGEPAGNEFVEKSRHACHCDADHQPAVPPEPPATVHDRSDLPAAHSPCPDITSRITPDEYVLSGPSGSARPFGPGLRTLLCSWLK